MFSSKPMTKTPLKLAEPSMRFNFALLVVYRW
jgi:hypothetical protein